MSIELNSDREILIDMHGKVERCVAQLEKINGRTASNEGRITTLEAKTGELERRPNTLKTVGIIGGLIALITGAVELWRR